jgi:hypothetical protein
MWKNSMLAVLAGVLGSGLCHLPRDNPHTTAQ